MLSELIALFFKVIFALFVFAVLILGLMNLFSKIKRKLTDCFGHELDNSDEKIRMAYVMKLDDEELLKEIAFNDYDEYVAFHAVERIKSKSILEDIAESDRFIVSREAERKLSEL